MNISSVKVLNNGVKMPIFGLGVYLSQAGEETVNAVLCALKAGYRLIDTATAYQNEEFVGEGIRRSGISRQEIFITTKMGRVAQREDRQEELFEESLKKLGTDYIDLYLIHWPIQNKYVKSWKLMEKWYKEGRIRAIGVSNFHEQHLEDIFACSAVVPAVNQIELHPLFSQKKLRAYCDQHNIAVQAWSPLGGNGTNLINDPRILAIAEKHNKSGAQIIIRWDIQSGVLTIPKSVHPQRIIQNADVFDFSLTDEEMQQIDEMNRDQRIGPDPDVPAY